jgi:hypothetical protein
MLPLSPATTPPTTGATPQRTLQLGRPLDFAMVSDHAEFLGEVRICGERGVFEAKRGLREQGGPLNQGYLSQRCVDLRSDPLGQFVSWNFSYLGRLPALASGDGISRFSTVCGRNGEHCLAAARSTWQEAIEAAEAAYDKTDDCEFTAFVGYEYTSTPISENMHRNVVFRNANVPKIPISYMEAKRPELLWARLRDGCRAGRGCEVLTIPHNSNVSKGRMFRRSVTRSGQGDFTATYARMRQKFEPLIEIYQHKGVSECGMNSADELCSFEKFPFDNLIADRFGGFLTSWPAEDNFVRYALKRGLALESTLGVNPFKYGLVGGTDTHLGTPGAVSEPNFPGHGGAGASNNDLVPAESGQAVSLEEIPRSMPTGLVDSIAFSGGGLTVIWSEENSRDYLFDAMRRREVYGTSGTRITVRFFGSWDPPQDMCDDVEYDPTAAALIRGEFARKGYVHGVAMGGDLTAPPAPDAAPSFAVAALRDPGFSTDDPGSDLFEPGTPLQQIHIIKGWLDESGAVHEEVVAVAGEPAAADDVDLATCESRGSGTNRLCTVWRDDSFDPAQHAFYYARVVESPTCRWSWRQCSAHARAQGVVWEQACADPGSLPEGFRSCCRHRSLSRGGVDEWLLGTYPETIQERAWTSPIWYRPEAG